VRFIAAAALVVVVAAVWYAASRIDRMHRRVERSRGTLRVQLVRRASVVLDLAHSGLWDPVSSIVVGESAREAIASLDDASPDAPLVAGPQSELTATLRAALGEPDDIAHEMSRPEHAAMLAELASVWYRAQLARRFYNEAVLMTHRLRSRRAVRIFHLAGRTPMPETFEMDDAPPQGLNLG
jgi:hypothetical protein